MRGSLSSVGTAVLLDCDAPGTREWAEQQIRLCDARGRISLRRVNALLMANGYPKVRS